MRLWFLLFAVLLWFGSCKSKQQEAPHSGPEPQLWAAYKIWAEEGDSMATCLLQFYDDPQKRQAIRLQKPAAIMVDGTGIEGDSAGFSGVFYEYHMPLAPFSGKHVITLVNNEKQVFADSFFLHPFRLAPLPQAVPVQDMRLQLEGLPDGSPVRVVLTDTSFSGFEYNELLTVRNRELIVQSTDLARLKSGPIVLFLSAEEDRPLRSQLPGVISVSYSTTRSFMLLK